MSRTEQKSLLTSKKGIVAIVLFVAASLVVYLNLSGGPKAPPMDPDEHTRSELSKLQADVIAFVEREQHLPAALTEVASPSNQDGWKHPFVLTTGTDGPKKTSFTLRSFGADGQSDTPDDWVATVIFQDDGYGKLGNEMIQLAEPKK